MKKKRVTRRLSHRTKTKRRLHHKVISFFKGDGGIYVIFVLASVMAGAFALSGGIVPNLDKNPQAAAQVTIDPSSAKQSDQRSLQLVDIKVKPTDTPTPTPPPNPKVCYDKSAVAIVVDVSGSMGTVDPGSSQSRLTRLKDALNTFLTNFQDDSVLSLISFSGTGNVLVPFNKKIINNAELNKAISTLTAEGSTNMKNALEDAQNQLNLAKITYPDYNRYTIFMTDGVPESGDCKYRNVTGQYHYYLADEKTICTIEGTTTEPTFYTHKWSPSGPAATIKNSGTRIFSIAMFQPSSDPIEAQKNNLAESLMKSVASNPDSTYYISSPTTKSLTSTYQEIAKKICPSP